MGDLSKQPLREIWDNFKFRKLKIVTREDRDSISFCRSCPEARYKICENILSFKKNRESNE